MKFLLKTAASLYSDEDAEFLKRHNFKFIEDKTCNMIDDDKDARPESDRGDDRDGMGGGEPLTPKPDVLPKPTYWPAILALGVTLLAWGVVTSALLSLLGLGISIVAVIRWIGDIRHEQGFGHSEQ